MARRTGRPRGRPGMWDWERPNPDNLTLYDMLVLAQGRELKPYALAKEVAGQMGNGDRNTIVRLGDKLKALLAEAVWQLYFRDDKLEQLGEGLYTEEEIRAEALEFVKDCIVWSVLTPEEHRQLDAAWEVIDRLHAKLDAQEDMLNGRGGPRWSFRRDLIRLITPEND